MVFRNPFEILNRPRLENPQGEEVEGAFTCQERGCWDTVHTARYLEEVKLLTWKCSNGHYSKIEGFEIDG